MTLIGWAQIVLVFAAVALAAFPLGRYIAAIAKGERTFLSPVLGPVERGLYRVAGIRESEDMGWRAYAIALIVLNAMHFAILYVMLRFQDVLPFNPAGAPAMSPQLAFNTAISFVTNTNWQAYSPESQISYGSQMWGLTVHMFISAASGIAVAFAVARGFARRGAATLGNLWVDVTRITLELMLPICLVLTVFYIISGVPMTLAPYQDATTIEGVKQTIALGPVAFEEAIKILGTNGGGFFNANSAHPFENPTALTSMVECWSIVVIGFGLFIAFGHIVGAAKQGRALAIAAFVLLFCGVAAMYAAEAGGNPLHTALGVDPSMGNFEGKEVRFGTALSALFATFTTASSCGAVNAMHDSLMPLGGLVALFMMQLGEVLPGGVGSGLYGMIFFAILAVFVAGLMVGRTPEYLGKKIQAREVKLTLLALLILPFVMLGGAALSLVNPVGLGSISNNGPHGLSEILYAWTEAGANNGSAFAGLTADTKWLDIGLGIAMLLGRFAMMIPVLAIAGSLASKPKLAPSAGTFPTDGTLFVGLLMGVIIIMGGLQFFPALSVGPIAEHFVLLTGKTF